MQAVIDIGGTKTLLCIVHENTILFEKQEKTAHITFFPDTLNAFLSQAGNQGYTTDTVIIAAAGPLHNDTISLTNASLTINKQEVLDHTLLSTVRLVNDLVALAHAPTHLISSAHTTQTTGSCVYLAPGTGLGVAFQTRYGVLASEAGHADLAAYDQEELSLLQAASISGTPEYESVLCGPGLERLYEAIRLSSDPVLTADEIVAERANIRAAHQAISYFATFLGRCARNLVLAIGASQVVLAGGVIQHAYPVIADAFRAEFVFGRYHDQLADVDVIVADSPHAVILGAYQLR